MNYAGNTKIIGKHFHEQQENLCIAVLSIIPLHKTIFFLTKVIFIQGAFKSIQGLFKDIPQYYSSIFKDMMLFQGLCEP